MWGIPCIPGYQCQGWLDWGGRDAAAVASRPPVLWEEPAWGLDQLGNWGTFDIDDTDNGLDLNQERAHNAANEVGTIAVASGGVGVNWVDPVHDAKGNMTTLPKGWSPASGLTCVYDAWNRLVEVKDGATTVGRYEYDGLGRRAVSGVDSAARGTPDGVDVWRHFFYNAAWQVVETRAAATSGAGPEGVVPEVQYVWSERYIDAAVLRDENLSDGSGGAADGDCEDGDDERLYYATDANMNVTSLLDAGGAAVERYEYTAYGQATVYNSDWSAEVSWSSSKRNAVRYCGYLWDWESDLHTVRHRVYTALLGRWGQRDPIGYADGASLYAYVRGEPLSYLDPSGLAPPRDNTMVLGNGVEIDEAGNVNHNPETGGSNGHATYAEKIQQEDTAYEIAVYNEVRSEARRMGVVPLPFSSIKYEDFHGMESCEECDTCEVIAFKIGRWITSGLIRRAHLLIDAGKLKRDHPKAYNNHIDELVKVKNNLARCQRLFFEKGCAGGGLYRHYEFSIPERVYVPATVDAKAVVGGALVGTAAVIAGATLLEDVATGGVGVLDDGLTLGVAEGLRRGGMALMGG